MDVPRTWRLKSQRYRLEGSRCPKCEELYFPPRTVCPQCRSRSLESYRFSGRGRVYSFTTVYQSSPRFAPFVPYVAALIDLEEGPRITARLTDVEPEKVYIGMPVEMVIRKISEEGDRGLIAYGYQFRPT